MRGAVAVAAIVQSMLQRNARPKEIPIIVADEKELEFQPTGMLPASIRDAIEVLVHDPHRSGGMAQLAASRDGNPIDFNRSIDEAEVVVPIDQLRLDTACLEGLTHWKGWSEHA